MDQTFENERKPWTRDEVGKGNEPRPRINVANMKRLVETGRKIGNEAVGHARRRPQLAIGIALATGFVAGSVFGSRLGQVIVAAATGYLVKHALTGDQALEDLRRTLERIVDGASHREHAEAEPPRT